VDRKGLARTGIFLSLLKGTGAAAQEPKAGLVLLNYPNQQDLVAAAERMSRHSLKRYLGRGNRVRPTCRTVDRITRDPTGYVFF